MKRSGNLEILESEKVKNMLPKIQTYVAPEIMKLGLECIQKDQTNDPFFLWHGPERENHCQSARPPVRPPPGRRVDFLEAGKSRILGPGNPEIWDPTNLLTCK